MTKGNILVTGGAGYIGSHTCKALKLAGYAPVAYDNLVYGHRWAVQWGDLVHADLADADALAACFDKYRPEAVIHFAAFTYVGESVQDPAKYYTNNVGCTLNLLDAMRKHGCPRIVFSSTCAVYGTPQFMPLTEAHPLAPINPYGHSKRFIEQILSDYGAAYGIRAAVLRYFNAAGADPDGDVGESHDPESHLIPLALRACRDNEHPLTVFGSDWDTPDGTCIRDYIHVADLAAAHLAAMDYLETHPAGAFNLGSENGHSVMEIIEAIKRVTGRPVNWNPGPRRDGDPARLVADSSLAKRELAWTPRYTDLDELIAHAWQWMQKQDSMPA